MTTPNAYAYFKNLLSHLKQATEVLHVKGWVDIAKAMDDDDGANISNEDDDGAMRMDDDD
jgi:hypothetical protein